MLVSELDREIAELIPRRASQGKTLDNNEKSFAAAHAIDKDLVTAAVAKTHGGAGWLKLMFDKTYFIKNIVIYYKFFTN